MSYAQVAGAVGIYPIRHVAGDLARYHRFGYVRRVRMAGKFRYEITRRGLERLAYFVRTLALESGAGSGAVVHRK